MQRRLDFWEDLSTSDFLASLIGRTMALFALLLVAATWRMWTPQTVFPQVPLLRVGLLAQAWWQWAGLSAIVAGSAATLLIPRESRWWTRCLLAYAAATASMVLIDQQRLQPWAYQFVLMALAVALADSPRALLLLRLLVVSFYFHSALSKFDYSFLHTLGQQFLLALTANVGASIDDWSDTTRVLAALVFPAAELFVALGLCFRPTRKTALVAAVLLHGLLLIILGPWGLNHKPGVLIWNIYFILQDILLFGIRRSAVPNQAVSDLPPARTSIGTRLAQGLIGAAVLLPFLAPFSWFDLWPSWGLYAASAQHVSLLVHRGELERLPEVLQAHAVPSQDATDSWVPIRIDRWALDALAAPIYPQNRSQLGVAESVVERYQLASRARVVRFSQAARFTGQRDYQVLTGLSEIVTAGNDYFFNARPRMTGP